METDNINVLYLDDEVQNLYAFKANYRKFFNVHIAATIHEAISILRKKEINVFIVDQRMPESLGSDLIRKVNIEYPDIISILVTGYLDEKEFVDNLLNQGGVFRYIRKPWTESEM